MATPIRFLKNAKWGEVKFGHNLSVAQTQVTVWSTTGLFPWATSWDLGASEITLQSSSVADDVGGIGCQSVEIVGLGGDNILKTVIVTMSGTNTLSIGTWSMIHRMNVRECGSTQRNVGTISAFYAAVEIATIIPLDGQTEMALYRVPQGMKGFLGRVWASSHDTDTADVSLYTRAPGMGWRLRAHFHISGGKIVEHPITSGLIHVDALMDIEVRAVGSNASGSEVEGGFDLVLSTEG